MKNHMNLINEAEFIEGVTCDFSADIAAQLNARCEAFVESDAARGLAMYAVTDYDNFEVAVAEMYSALDVASDAFGLTLK